MNSTPLYIIIGSILGMIATVALLILHLPQIIHIIGSAVVRSFKWLIWRPTMIKRWYWWKKYRPSWRIAEWGEVKITHIAAEQFQIELPLHLELESRNDKYNSVIEPYGVRLFMYHLGKGWEKQPYRLGGKLIDPAFGQFKLKAKDSVLVAFICNIVVSTKPIFADTVTCKVFSNTRATIVTPFVYLSGAAKRKGNKHFKAKVL